MFDLTQFRETDGTCVVRVMEIEDAWWIPPDDDGDIMPQVLSLEYDPVQDNGGNIYLRVWGQDGPEVLLTGRQFLAALAFLLDEGLAEACGLESASGDDQIEDDGDALAAFILGEEVAGEPASPFPLPELVPGSCDKMLLRDPDWLRAMHHDHGLSAADIGRLCSVSGNTVINWIHKAGIEFRSIRGRSNMMRVPEIEPSP